MEKRSFLIFFCLSAMITWSCQKEETFLPVYEVPEEFQPHVEKFIQEAALRGHSLEITNLIIRYDSTLSHSLCGACNSSDLSANVQKIISINQNHLCWENEYQLEALIFHEMGHCILGRSHTSERLPNNDPKSLMIANDITVYSPCVYDISGGNCDQRFKRTYYLDELFDESASVPSWAE